MRLGHSTATIPEIGSQDNFDQVVRKLAVYFINVIESPHDFEELSRVIYGRTLRPLVKYLVSDVHFEGVISALLALRWHFSSTEETDDRGLNRTRGLACEIVAWRFVSHLTEREAIEYLCYELPAAKAGTGIRTCPDLEGDSNSAGLYEADERRPLLDGTETGNSFNGDSQDGASGFSDTEETFAVTFAGLNALEIGAVVGAKKFLAEKSIQRIINGIWKGDIVFWNLFSARSVKKAQLYSKDRSDPFCRLRVPVYLKIFEIIFFAAFLAFYYAVLIGKETKSVPAVEILLYFWLAAFAYNELGEYWDAGITFYATDFWSSWDLGIIAVGVAFFVARMVGVAGGNDRATSAAFDILSLEALLLVPRICSLLSLHPYFGMLLPALKEMTKDFVKFLGLVAILYIGFDTTFTFLARGSYTFREMNWILVKVFFGSGYLRIRKDIADEISPILGAPLMLIFVCMTNILLITSLISLLSNSLTKVMEHARDEYLFVYSVYVLEAATSNRLTYFLPPLNLVPLLLRPLRLVLRPETLRSVRIVLLKATHWPFVALILGYESWRLHLEGRRNAKTSSLHTRGPTSPRSLRRLQNPLLTTGTRHSRLAEEARGARLRASAPEPALVQTDDSLEVALNKIKSQVDTMLSIVKSRRT